jgi:hypothetical protein
LSEFYPSYYKLTILSVSCYSGIQLYPEAAIGSSRPLEAYDYLSSYVVVVVVRGRRRSWSSVRRRPWLVGVKFYPTARTHTRTLSRTLGHSLTHTHGRTLSHTMKRATDQGPREGEKTHKGQGVRVGKRIVNAHFAEKL